MVAAVFSVFNVWYLANTASKSVVVDVVEVEVVAVVVVEVVVSVVVVVVVDVVAFVVIVVVAQAFGSM